LSRDDESIGDSLSIVNQKAMLEKYAAQNGFFNIAHFSDDGYSGGNFDRPDWKKLIEEIEKGNVATVISKDMSRIGRDYLQTGFYTEVFFGEKNVRFIAIANNIDSQNRESGEFASFLNIMSSEIAATQSAYLQTVKLAERGTGERRAAHPCRCYFKHTFTAGEDRQIRPLSSYRQSEICCKNTQFFATKSNYGHGGA
jgi:hypothetical protein